MTSTRISGRWHFKPKSYVDGVIDMQTGIVMKVKGEELQKLYLKAAEALEEKYARIESGREKIGDVLEDQFGTSSNAYGGEDAMKQMKRISRDLAETAKRHRFIAAHLDPQESYEVTRHDLTAEGLI